MQVINSILVWLKSMLADTNGVPDEARICAVALVLAYIALAAFDVVAHHHPFDMQQFGVGAAALGGGIGGWFKLRGSE